MTYWRTPALLVLGLAALLVAGCQREEIDHYQVGKEEKPKLGPVPRGKGGVRLLGAIIPRDQKTWVFKLKGPAAVVSKYKDEFDRFINSIRFQNQEDAPIAWKVPEGWKEMRGAGPPGAAFKRYTTFYLNLKQHPLELTVFDFAGGAGSVQANVNRWRKLDLGLGDVTDDAELAKITREIKVDGVSVTLVDMARAGAGEEEQ